MVWSLTESIVMSALISDTVVSLCGSPFATGDLLPEKTITNNNKQ